MQIPDSAPFTPAQRQALSTALTGLTPLQSGWLSGFIAGQGAAAATAPALVPATLAPVPVTVLYGTESGNSENLAADDFKALKAKGFNAKMVNMADIKPEALAGLENLLVIVSTWGDGEPPDGVGSFFNGLMGAAAPQFDHTKYSVCALGDTSYEKFCQCGKDIDRRLEELGGTRLVDRMDCDVDYEEAHGKWFSDVLDALEQIRGASVAVATTAIAAPASVPTEYGKKNPFPSPLKRRIMLNGPGSAKETWHLEFGLEGSGMTYEPGDALALIPHNAPDVVDNLLKAGGFAPNTKVNLKDGGEVALGEAFHQSLDITGLTSVVLGKYNNLAKSDKITALLDPANKEELGKWLHGRQIVDMVEEFPVPGLAPQDFVGVLRKLPPRLYSISSSLKAHPGEVHLTIAAVRYQAHGKERKGVASTFIADLLSEDGTVGVYTHQNKNFKLPRSGDTPIIMVGPGTGVAPYRSFVEERSANGDKGKSWLIFGDQHYTFDFLYQLEWQDHLKSGALTRMDVAFSRDQKEKVYVQHRMLAHAREMWAWLEEGAHFYVCGDASRMAHDVHEALLQIAINQGGLNRATAEAYVEDLKKSKRYQRDVY